MCSVNTNFIVLSKDKILSEAFSQVKNTVTGNKRMPNIGEVPNMEMRTIGARYKKVIKRKKRRQRGLRR
jgi:hypothetical protein